MNKIKLSILPGLLIVFFSLSCKTLQKKDDPNFLGDFSPKTIAKVMAEP